MYDKKRFRNLEKLEARNIDPYSTIFDYFPIDKIITDWKKYIGKEINVIGRVIKINVNGDKFEGVITGWKKKLDFIINSNYSLCNYLDEGDIIQILGKLKEKESLCIDATEFFFITKSLREYPLKNKWFKDLKKHRVQYETSLLLSDRVKDNFINRCKTLSTIRHFLENKGFIEVDSPILLPLPTMAPVKDFITAKPEFNPISYLRISNTDYMRRYIISGLERIFHIGKFFRDESLTFKGNFEFTMLTFCLTFGTYKDIANIIEETIEHIIDNVFYGNKVVTFRNKEINLARPWRRITMREAICEYSNIDIGECYDEESLRRKMCEKGIKLKKENLHVELIDELLNKHVIPNLIEPTYITDFPHVFGGPAKEIPTDSRFKQRCELFINGVEIANMSTHENNPTKLRLWFENTLNEKEKKGWSKQKLHEDYFFPMEIGSPPCASGGVGVDRLIMLLTNSNRIIDTIPFSWNFGLNTKGGDLK